MKTNKAFGLDKISARLLKDSVGVITPSLTHSQINIVDYLHECECSVQRLSEKECTAVVRAVYTGTEQCERVCSE